MDGYNTQKAKVGGSKGSAMEGSTVTKSES